MKVRRFCCGEEDDEFLDCFCSPPISNLVKGASFFYYLYRQFMAIFDDEERDVDETFMKVSEIVNFVLFEFLMTVVGLVPG